MGDIPCLFTDTTSSVRRMQAMEQSRFSHGHGGSSLGILGAESYLDGNTLSIAQSLTELARQPAHGMAMGWTVRYDENFETSGTATPPILKARQAEVELDRNSERRRSNGAQAKKKPGGRSEEAEENQPAKKRTKRRSSDGDDGGNEAEKKARGRPRLDTKDESAADRRRTQIRMAQRAYRNRKETTITSLEKKVERLQSMTEEMNTAFSELYDLAMKKGLLQKDPEFGQQFQIVTRRFLALAKSAGGDDNSTQEDGSSLDLSAPALFMDSEKQGNERQDTHPDMPSPDDERSKTLATDSVWGYEISHSSADAASTTRSWFEQLPTPSLPRPPEHEIIARATKRNANFPFDMYHYDQLPSTSTIQNDYHANYATIGDISTAYPSSMQLTAPFNPWTQPVFSGSYAYQESSFGRRLHRTIIERGYHLLMNPHKSPLTFKRVFGLSLKHYPKDLLAEAMHRAILRMRSEPLSQWDLPFVNLVGSGTHSPPTQQEQSVIAKVGTGRSIGPVTEVMSESMKKCMLDNYRSKVPGYEGIWFDTYDVERYLKKRGIHIPHDVEWLTVDLDKINLAEVVVAGNMVMPLSSSGHTSDGTTATSSSQTPYLNSLGLQQQRQETVQSVEASLEFFLASMGNECPASSYMAPCVSGSTTDFNLKWNTNKVFTGTPLGSSFDFGTHPLVTEAASDVQSQRLVTINVTKLLEAILRKGICLGRAPGFKPSDVDKALKRTIQEAS